jgi:hypothetical protein
MSLDAFLEECTSLRAAFPDLVVTFDSIEEIRPNVVKISNFTSHGTHTGTAFAFGPFLAIAPIGKVFDEDYCQITIYLSRGKMTKKEADLKDGGKMKMEDDSSSRSSGKKH